MSAVPTSRRIAPDDPHHEQLLREVADWLLLRGFMLEANAYHDRLSPEFIRRISIMRDLNAVIVRTTADRVAIHRRADFSMNLELKTISGPHPNLAVEALPLYCHRLKSKAGARCLYVVRDVATGRHFEGGFWSSAEVPADALFVPQAHAGTPLERVLRTGFPGLPVYYPPRVGGSGDPFVRVPRRAFDFMADWRTLVVAHLDQAKELT